MEKNELMGKVQYWSKGFTLEGETKQELKESLREIAYKLECEISDKASKFEEMIKNLDIEEGT